MNKYVSPIMEMEEIDVEDICFLSQEGDNTPDSSDPGISEDELPPVDLTSVTNYFN